MASNLAVTDQETDLGGVVGNSLNMATQCPAAMKKANPMLGIIRKGIVNKMADIIAPLYKSSNATFGIQFWLPSPPKRFVVQKKASKMINSLEPLSYNKSLKRFKFF